MLMYCFKKFTLLSVIFTSLLYLSSVAQAQTSTWRCRGVTQSYNGPSVVFNEMEFFDENRIVRNYRLNGYGKLLISQNTFEVINNFIFIKSQVGQVTLNKMTGELITPEVSRRRAMGYNVSFYCEQVFNSM